MDIIFQICTIGSICMAGIFLICIVGYINGSVISRFTNFSAEDRSIFAPVLFFPVILGAFLVNSVLSGRLFSSYYGIYVFLICWLAICLFIAKQIIAADILKFKKWLKQNIRQYRSPKKFLLLVAVILAGATLALLPAFLGVSLSSGDLMNHLFKLNRVLMGDLYPDVSPYLEIRAAPGYPFLSYYFCAFFVRLFFLHPMDSFAILVFVQAVFLPLGVFFLLKKLTKSSWPGIMGAFLCLFYFGWATNPKPRFFLLAVENLLQPHHAYRMLSLAFLPYFFLVIHDIRAKKWKWGKEFTGGLLIGFMGLAHPYACVFALSFCVLYIFINFRSKILFNMATIAMFGIMLAVISYLPYFEFITQDPANTLPSLLSKGQQLITPDLFVYYYGILLLSFVFVFLFYKQDNNVGKVCTTLAVTVIFVLAVTYLKDFINVHFDFNVPNDPRQNRFGKSICLSLIICFAFGFYQLWFFKNNKNKLYYIAYWTVLVISILGVIYSWMIMSDKIVDYTLGDMVSMKQYKYLKDERYLSEGMRCLLNKNDVVALQNKYNYSRTSGARVLYFSGRNFHVLKREVANNVIFYPHHDELTKKIARHFHTDFKNIRLQVLEDFDVSYLLTKDTDVMKIYDNMDFTKQVKTFLIDPNNEYKVYSVNKSYQKHIKDIDLSSLYSNPEICIPILGYIPFEITKIVKPKIYSRKSNALKRISSDGNFIYGMYDRDELLKFSNNSGRVLDRFNFPFSVNSLTYKKNGLWVLSKNQNEILKISPDDGKIIEKKSFLEKNIDLIIDMTVTDNSILVLRDLKVEEYNRATQKKILEISVTENAIGVISWRSKLFLLRDDVIQFEMIGKGETPFGFKLGNKNIKIKYGVCSDTDGIWVYAKNLRSFVQLKPRFESIFFGKSGD